MDKIDNFIKNKYYYNKMNEPYSDNISWLTREDIKVYFHRKVLKLLYSMTFPYRTWDYDYLSAAYNVVKEVRKWCQPHMIPILLMVGKVMKLEFKSDERLSDICQRVVNKIMDISLIAVKPLDASLTISFKTGVPPHIESSKICNNIVNIFGNVNLYKHDVIWVVLWLYEYDLDIMRLNGELSEKKINQMEQKILIELNSSSKNYLDTLIFMKADQDETPKLALMSTYQDMMFFLYLLELFKTKKIPLEITFDQLCSNPEILKFGSWLEKQPRFNTKGDYYLEW